MASAGSPVLVFNPVRTASSSLGQALQASDIPHVTTHGLDWAFWGLRERYTASDTLFDSKLPAVGIEMERMRRVDQVLQAARRVQGPRLKMIVGLREPLDHLFSILGFYFHVEIRWLIAAGMASERDGNLLLDADGYATALDAAVRLHSEQPQAGLEDLGIGDRHDHDPTGRGDLNNFFAFYLKYLQTWLRRELRDWIGIDSSTLHLAQGFALLGSGYADVLVYNVSAATAPAISGRVSDFLGQRVELPHINASIHRSRGFHAMLQDLKRDLPSRRLLMDSYRADPFLVPLIGN